MQPKNIQQKTDDAPLSVPTGEGSALEFFKKELFPELTQENNGETKPVETNTGDGNQSQPEAKPEEIKDNLDQMEALPEGQQSTEPSKEENNETDLPEDIAKATEKSKSSFRKLQAKLEEEINARKSLEEKLADAQKVLEESKGKQIDESKVTELEDKVNKYEQELSIVRVQSTETFKNQVTKPAEKIGTALAEIAKKNNLDENILIDTIIAGDDLSDVVSSLSERDRYNIYRYQEEYETIKQKRAELVANSQKTLEQIKIQEELDTKAKKQDYDSQISKAMTVIWDKFQEAFPIFKKGTVGGEWDAEIQKAEQVASSLDFGSLGPQDVAVARYRAALFDPLLTATSNLLEQVNKLQEENRKLKSVKPSPAKGNSGAEVSGKETKPDASFIEVMVSNAKELGLK